MHFGFSYVGFIYIVMLTVPNIIWAKNKPKDYEKYVVNESKVLGTFERIGEVLVTTIVLIFADFNLRPWTWWCLWLVVSFVLMVLYEIYWVRYFKSEKTMHDQYRQFLCFPVAGASLPASARAAFLRSMNAAIFGVMPGNAIKNTMVPIMMLMISDGAPITCCTEEPP